LTAANAAAQAALIETGFGISTNGIMARTGSGVATTRHIVGGPEIAVANGDGVSGNPTLSVNNDSITTNKVDSAFRALLGGCVGGISRIRVTDGTTDADGITNILFNPAGGSGFAITVTDMGTRADVDFEWLSPGFGINGTFPTYGTDRWNINSTTPSAPSQTTVTRPVSSSTNVVMVVDVAPTLAGISRQTWSNSTAYVLVASGTFNTTNMPYNGAMLQGVVGGTIKNNSGANTTIRPVFMVGSTTNYLSNGHLNLADSATTRAWRFDFEFYRASSTLIGGGFNHTVSGASAPTIGTGSLSSTPTVTQRNALFADVACDISTNTTWAFYLSVDVANTTNIVSVTYGGMK